MRSLVQFKERVSNTAGSSTINDFWRINAETSEYYEECLGSHHKRSLLSQYETKIKVFWPFSSP